MSFPGSKETLNWGIRYKIILGTAEGLLYLHENCQRRIIHRDIKADNILLTEDFEPQVYIKYRLVECHFFVKVVSFMQLYKERKDPLGETFVLRMLNAIINFHNKAVLVFPSFPLYCSLLLHIYICILNLYLLCF